MEETNYKELGVLISIFILIFGLTVVEVPRHEADYKEMHTFTVIDYGNNTYFISVSEFAGENASSIYLNKLKNDGYNVKIIEVKNKYEMIINTEIMSNNKFIKMKW